MNGNSEPWYRGLTPAQLRAAQEFICARLHGMTVEEWRQLGGAR